MSRVATVACLAGMAAAGGLGADGPSAGSMSKVISMLNDMAAKVKQEKNDEQVAFSKFGTWCKMESSNLEKEIVTDKDEIASLTTEIAELQSESKTLGETVAQLESDVEKFETDMKENKEQREKDHTDFLAEQSDYEESIDAIERALDTLQAQSADREAKAGASLLETDSIKHMPVKLKSIIAAFAELQQGADDGSPEANAYEFQSGGIVNLLKKLQDDFRAKLGETQKAEANSKHASAMVVQDLTDSIAFAKKDISERSMLKKQKEEKTAEDQKQLASTETVLAQSEKTLETMNIECKEKGLSFDEKQQLRSEEIDAIGQAVEILGAPDVAGQSDKHFSMAQGAAALVQLRSDHASAVSGPRKAVREFLEAEGDRLHSHGLALLAQKISADPFGKVKGMIDAMITRLLEEANADAVHEGFCDTELGKSKITRTKLSEDIDALAAAVEEGKANIMMLTNRIAELSTQVSNLDTAMLEAGELRASEKATNIQTIAEAKQAQEKVAAATAVLKDFYAKAAKTTALVQAAPVAMLQSKAEGIPMGSDEWISLANPAFQGEGGYSTGPGASKVDRGHKAGMQTFGGAYKGNQDAAAGVFALLEVILSDFANLEADTNASEDASQRAYEGFITESKKNKAVANKQIDMDTADKTNAEARLQEDTADMKATQDELLAADRYHAKLVPQCMDPGQTFEERTAARESEIASLKEALKILGNPDIETSA
jgi:predicted  nucleic acid-binding Zn-ribbon protein